MRRNQHLGAGRIPDTDDAPIPTPGHAILRGRRVGRDKGEPHMRCGSRDAGALVKLGPMCLGSAGKQCRRLLADA